MGALANETAAMGAPTWWARQHLGGTGTSDIRAANLAVMDDKIQEDQPLLADVDFESPQGSYSGTFCDQASAGCEHGTEVAGMAVATGNAKCASLCTADSGTERGVAYGVQHVLDADITAMPDSASCHYDSAIWAFGITQPPIGDCTHSLPGAAHPAYVHSDSHGAYATEDDGYQPRNLDKFASLYGAIETEPSGNDGVAAGGAGQITRTCDAYDVICVGGISANDPTTSGDDAIADFSSRGPSPGGRKKPDLVAIAAGTNSGNMTVLEQRYGYYNRLERGDTGTSFASPQVAGAAALLYGAGLTDPLVVKAILIDSATLGRATPASPMGTQTTWQPDWGWGELNLSSAYDQRGNFAADAVAALGVRFYRATVAAGDRATLVWNRRVVGPLDQVVPPTAMTLSNLDLFQYDAGTGAQQAWSTSVIDNVEQVRGAAGGQVIYKVKDQSTRVDGAPAEPFALAAANPLTPLTSPVPHLELAVDRARVRRGEPVTLTAALTNASADLAASGAAVVLNLPAGVSATDGPVTWTPGALPAGATLTHVWKLEGDADSTAAVGASASADAYGETFRSAASVPLTVDSSPPALNLVCGHADAVDPEISVAWSGTDTSPVAGYQLGVSTDGGPFVAWRSDSGNGSAAFAGSPGHSYAVELSASDSLGNVAAPVRCGPVAVGFAPLPPVLPSGQGGSVVPASPRLRLTRVSFHRSRLVVSGSIARGARGRISASYAPRGARGAHARGRAARGRYTLAFRLTRRQLRARRGVVRVSYAGDSAYAPQRLSRRVANRH